VRNLVKAVCCAAVLASPAAMAGTTGNIGAVSEYMYRGIVSSGGAAVQGGIDHAFDAGAYVGTWMSNAAGATGASELDLYGGYTFTAGKVALDVGGLYYLYNEDKEAGNTIGADFIEVYVGATLGPVAIKASYSPDYFKSDDLSATLDSDSLYINVTGSFAINDTLTFVPQIGFSSGDGVKAAIGDTYTDYSLSLAKKVGNDMTVAFGLYATDLDETNSTGAFGNVLADSDAPKAVASFKKTFDF